MGMPDLKFKILRVLAENAINNVSPYVMDSDSLSTTLDINLATTKQLLNALHASGLIITNMDSQSSLITQEGIHWLKRMGFSVQDPKDS